MGEKKKKDCRVISYFGEYIKITYKCPILCVRVCVEDCSRKVCGIHTCYNENIIAGKFLTFPS